MPTYHADRPSAHHLDELATTLVEALGATPVAERTGRRDEGAPRQAPLHTLWNERERDELHAALRDVLRARLAPILAAARQRM
jgi:hypothetical protein